MGVPMRAVGERRTSRHMLSVLATIGLVGAMQGILAPAAAAVVNTCWARNVTQGTPSGSDLQAVITAASPDDRIAVKFVCVGNFTIDKNLTLVGRRTPEVLRPILNANGAGRVLVVSARVKLTYLTITGGDVAHSGGGIRNTITGILTLTSTVLSVNNAAGGGGGIYNRNGTVNLKDTVVSGNTAAYGGGIYDHSGTLTLRGTSSVTGNTAAGGGGGIFTQARSAVTLKGTSSVSVNTAYVGGGIFNESGALTLYDSSSVSANTADRAGGGIANNENGSITLNDSSSVNGNTSRDDAGGIYNYSNYGTINLNDSSSVTGNTADSDNDAFGIAGGIFVGCTGTLTGAVDGDNVNDNYLGTASPVEDNIFYSPCG